MKDDIDNMHRISALATDVGLILRGWFRVRENDRVPMPESGRSAAVLLLFGQTGSAAWHCFTGSAEYADGEANPMDRWSYRIGRAMAEGLGGSALFPFEGPPWHPFGQWAQRVENTAPSPLGILMHSEYGLWHAYRFAIALPQPLEGFDAMDSSRHLHPSDHHACDHCKDQPCLAACPVSAFSDGAYNLKSCADYLRRNEQADCHSTGCRARGACPQGTAYRYEPDHRQFHMQQFYAALKQPE